MSPVFPVLKVYKFTRIFSQRQIYFIFLSLFLQSNIFYLFCVYHLRPETLTKCNLQESLFLQRLNSTFNILRGVSMDFYLKMKASSFYLFIFARSYS